MTDTTDYGHDLLFGTFVTPTNRPTHHAIEQAVVADRAGLDLVTFQDHPYVAKFHDTSTLLAFAAARTERIRLAANVTSLPLRPPAVLARSIATLAISSAIIGCSARSSPEVRNGPEAPTDPGPVVPLIAFRESTAGDK